MTSRPAPLVSLALALAACATASTIPGESPRDSGQPGAGSVARRAIALHIDDRVVIPSMSIVQAVDVSDRYVFVATPAALGIYDRRFSSWLPPFTFADGWPGVAISSFMADPGDAEAVWFVADNIVFRYRVGSYDVVRALVPQRVAAGAVFVDARDRASGLIVRIGYTTYPLPRQVRGETKTGENSYVRVSPTGSVLPIDAWTVDPLTSRETIARFTPPTLRSVYAQYPALQEFQRLLTQDASMRSWPVTSAAVTPIQSEAWMGTAGGGLFKVDPLFSRGEQLPFGLLSDGAGAVGTSAGGVWVGGIGRPGSTREGLTFIDNDLKRWRWIDGGAASPFAGARVTAIAQYGTTIWAATDRGVVRMDNQSGDARRAWDGGGGVPLALAATSEGVWVGTTRGLSFVHEPTPTVRATAVDAPAMEGSAVRALTRRGDTLWIGADAGVLVLVPGETRPRQLRAPNDSRLTQPIHAIATSDSIVVVATLSDEVLRIHTRTGVLLEPASLVNSRGGRIYSIALDATSMWIGGEAGLTIVNRTNGVQRFVPAYSDLAGPVYGIALTKEYAWIASRDAAVRLRRTDDGTIR